MRSSVIIGAGLGVVCRAVASSLLAQAQQQVVTVQVTTAGWVAYAAGEEQTNAVADGATRGVDDSVPIEPGLGCTPGRGRRDGRLLVRHTHRDRGTYRSPRF
jgi:hypothetical protein